MNPYPRILLLGAAGQVGRELLRSFSDYGEVLAQDRRTVDLAIPEQVRSFIRNAMPDVILNAAAYTAVDRAESEPEIAMAINGRAPGILAEEAERAGALLVHYSTDYVFDGSRTNPWSETDAPNPLNVYGASKLEGEEAIQRVGGRYLIFRTSWVYGPHGSNFLRTMLRLGRERDQLSVVDDQYGAPTTSIELARATRAIVDAVLANQVDTGWEGLYHMTCSGCVSWFGFAQAIFARAAVQFDQRTPTLKAIAAGEFNAKARRPSNSVLSNEKLFARFGVRLAPWGRALDEVMGMLQSDATPVIED
jgi:dTDP-4-dehydrorhamnose reductase